MTRLALLARTVAATLTTAALAAATPAHALDLDLGNAAAYSVFIFEDVTGLSSDLGRLAVGGNLSVTTATIGAGTPTLDNTPALVVRGSIRSYSGGALWNGSVPGFGLYLGTKSTTPASLDLRKATTLPVDVDTERVYLGVMSEQWRDTPDTGAVSRQPGTLQLTGSQAAIEVFSLTAADLGTAQALAVANVRADAHIVLNVSADAKRRIAFALDTAALQPWQGRVLVNAHDAETLQFGGLTVWASVLAPNGCICSSTGSLQGSVVARKWNATMSVTYTPFVPGP